MFCPILYPGTKYISCGVCMLLLCICTVYMWHPQARMWCENCCGNKTKTICNLAAIKTTLNYSPKLQELLMCLILKNSQNISNFRETEVFEKAVLSKLECKDAFDLSRKFYVATSEKGDFKYSNSLKHLST